MSENDDLNKIEKQASFWLTVIFGLLFVVIIIGPAVHHMMKPVMNGTSTAVQKTETKKNDFDINKIENGIHVRTGLIDAEGLMAVVNNCTQCHSSKIIVQNRMSADSWNATIKWMQESQNLWDLGDKQEIIVNYLVTNYPMKKKGRRENLSNVEWYVLEDD